MEHLFKRIKSLEPITTGHTVNVKPIEGIKAVLFDIYGTLLISASGDVGSSSWKGQSAVEVLKEFNVEINPNVNEEDLGLHVVNYFTDTILNSHQRSKEMCIPHPEVNIIEASSIRQLGWRFRSPIV